MTADLLKEAIDLIHGQRVQEARIILQKLIQADLHNIPAWFWYAQTCATPEKRLQILEACAQHNPDNLQVQQALQALTRPPKQPTPPPAVDSVPSSPAAAEGQPSMRVSAAQPAANPPASAPAAVERSKSRKTNPRGFSFTAGLVWLVACLLVVGLGWLGYTFWNTRPKDPSAYRHTQPIEYYLYVPGAYKPDGTWPLFIGIHGTGGSGLDCWNLWQSYADREGFVLLCPSLADSNGGWYQSDGENKLWASISQVQSEYPVAPRFFLAGFSAGAQFVQGFSFDYPLAVQGTAVLSAGNYYPPTSAASGLPFLVVIGDQDDPIAIQASQQFANGLAQVGAVVEYWLLPGVGHQATARTQQLTIDFFRKAYGK